MAIATKALKLKNVGQHPIDIAKSARAAISNLAAAVEDAKKFTAYMVSPISVLTIDSEDRAEYCAMFQDVALGLNPVMASFAELNALNNEDITKEAYILGMEAAGLNLVEYAAQFK